MEVNDPNASRRAFEESTLPIDLQHREVMRDVVDKRLDAELLLDASAVRPGP